MNEQARGPVDDGAPLAWGIQLPVQAQSPYFAAEWERGFEDPSPIVDVARAADEAGADYVAVCDHVAIPRGPVVEAIGTTWYDPIATLAYVAAWTRRVRLLTNVLVAPYRHPLHIAKSTATIDRLSGGRMLLGLGAGYLEPEFAGLGVDHAHRGRATDEVIAAVRRLWTEEFASFAGERYAFEDLAVSPRPVQATIPIWTGGRSPAALRRAGRLADGWIPEGTPRVDMPGEVAQVRAARAAAGRTGAFAMGFLTEVVDLGGRSDRSDAIAGSAEQVAESLRAVAALGVTHLQVRFHHTDAADLEDQVRRFGAEVVPLLPTSSHAPADVRT